MLRNIVPREPKEEVYYRLEFTNDEGGGFSFDCDEQGNPEFACEAASANYQYALQHPEKFPVAFNQKVRRVHRYTENARGTCSCGEEVELYDQYQGACPCPRCGQWYDLFGQELIDPEYWDDDVSESEPW